MGIIQKVFADTTLPTIDPTKINQTGGFTDLVQRILTYIWVVAGAVAVIYLIYSGFLYITAAGNADNAKKGQQGIINAIIGIVIILLSYWIVTAVVSLITSGK